MSTAEIIQREITVLNNTVHFQHSMVVNYNIINNNYY